MSVPYRFKLQITVSTAGGSGTVTVPEGVVGSWVQVTLIKGPSGGVADYIVLDCDSDPVYIKQAIPMDALLSAPEDTYPVMDGFTLKMNNASAGTYTIKGWQGGTNDK